MEPTIRARAKVPPELRLDDALALLRRSGRAAPIEDESDGWKRTQQVIDGLCELTLCDALTGLPNGEHFRQMLERELERVARMGDGASLLLIGVEHIKRAVDTSGSSARDAVLSAVAAILVRSVRKMDFVARLGEEDFAVILPGGLPQNTRGIAQRLRAVVARSAIRLPGELTLRVTASVGGASATPWRRMRAGTLIAAADRQLLAARSRRKDHISIDALPSTRISMEERLMLLGDPGRSDA
jgi:two-component system cell cycle response regulator